MPGVRLTTHVHSTQTIPVCKSLSFDEGFDTALRDLAAIFEDAITEINSEGRRLEEEDDSSPFEIPPILLPLSGPVWYLVDKYTRESEKLKNVNFSRMKFSQVGATVLFSVTLHCTR